jgi:hypothetical protein
MLGVKAVGFAIQSIVADRLKCRNYPTGYIGTGGRGRCTELGTDATTLHGFAHGKQLRRKPLARIDYRRTWRLFAHCERLTVLSGFRYLQELGA